MSKKFLYLLLLAVLLAQITSSVVFAATGTNCPTGFMLESAMHEHHPDHQHVGTSADQNGDGYICVKHVTPDEAIHVHVDNNVP
jgi:hypothetical protein